jgi:hypothetical protein
MILISWGMGGGFETFHPVPVALKMNAEISIGLLSWDRKGKCVL